MVLPIVQVGDPVLRAEAAAVTDIIQLAALQLDRLHDGAAFGGGDAASAR